MGLNNLLSHEDGTQRMVEDCIDIIEQSAGVVIFGAGVGGWLSIILSKIII